MLEVNKEEIKKILIIQYQPFGDVLLNTGYMPALRRKFAEAKIDFLVRKPYHNALLENPYLDELIIFQNGKGIHYLFDRMKLIRKIRSRNYDLIIDQIRNIGSAEMTLFSGAKYRLGFDHQKWSFVYNLKAKRKYIRYHSAMKFDVLNPLGIEEEKHTLTYHINEKSQKYIEDWLREKGINDSKIVCVSPGSPVKSKQWSLKSYAELADRIIEATNCQLILLWAPKEINTVKFVQSIMKNKSLLAPATTFNQAAAMLKKCDLLICNDGGINHLSVATNTPSIAIFGKHNPRRWSPVIFEGHYHFYNEKADYKTDRTLGIEVEEVFNKVLEIVKI